MEPKKDTFDARAAALDELLGTGRSFDMVTRPLTIAGRRARLWVVNGYAEDALLERAKPYTVSLYSWQRTKLEKEAHALIPKCGGSILVLQEGYYDENTGLVPEAGQMDYMEV